MQASGGGGPGGQMDRRFLARLPSCHSGFVAIFSISVALSPRPPRPRWMTPGRPLSRDQSSPTRRAHPPRLRGPPSCPCAQEALLTAPPAQAQWPGMLSKRPAQSCNPIHLAVNHPAIHNHNKLDPVKFRAEKKSPEPI